MKVRLNILPNIIAQDRMQMNLNQTKHKQHKQTTAETIFEILSSIELRGDHE